MLTILVFAMVLSRFYIRLLSEETVNKLKRWLHYMYITYKSYVAA